jgi:hypothetical protein
MNEAPAEYAPLNDLDFTVTDGLLGGAPVLVLRFSKPVTTVAVPLMDAVDVGSDIMQRAQRLLGLATH